LGYLVVPPSLLERFLDARHYIDVHLPILEQMALADFIADGHFTRHLRKMRGIYLERRNTLIEALRSELSDLLEIVVPEAGMHLVAWLPNALNAQNISFNAAAKGVYVTPVSKFSFGPLARDGLVLGFANANPQALRDGVKILAGCILGEGANL
jgi:GntR family transcriptional regulator/MocR family aminotransferase